MAEANFKLNIMELKAFQQAYGEWASKNWPNATLDTICSHFREEAAEFAGYEDDYQKPEPSHNPEEAADCLLLLLHHAHRAGYNLMGEAIRKAKINIKREWDHDNPAEGGHVKHKKTEEPLHNAEEPTLMDALAIKKCTHINSVLDRQERCSGNAEPGFIYCKTHLPFYRDSPPSSVDDYHYCKGVDPGGEKCTAKLYHGGQYCRNHR